MEMAGGGGSSYISGHDGCIAISEESTSDNIIMLEDANHYSGYVFTNTVMISGINEQMTEPDGTVNSNFGHSGNGHVRITYLGS